MQFLYRFTSPKFFYFFSQKASPWVWGIFLLLFVSGLIGGLGLAPPDYQQGDAFRIIYIHVPSAVLSLAIYVVMAISAAVALIWRIKLADMVIQASVGLGASFTLLALITGALWGKPTWGTWWLWDARLTSELILLFLYFGILALRNAITNPDKAMKASAILILVGTVDLPIIHYSVYWWNTLHQKATILKIGAPTIASEMLWPLLLQLVAFFLFYFVMLLANVRTQIVRREINSSWVKELYIGSSRK